MLFVSNYNYSMQVAEKQEQFDNKYDFSSNILGPKKQQQQQIYSNCRVGCNKDLTVVIAFVVVSTVAPFTQACNLFQT